MPGIFTTLDKVKPLYDLVSKVLMVICKLFLIADILITSMSVAGRYISFIPDPSWSEEVVLTCMSYMAVLSAALAIRRKAHIRMTAFDRFLPAGLLKALDLAADIATRYSPNRVEDEKTGELYEPHMKISGNTLTWATIEVETPYLNLDTTELATKGTFSFEAVFDKIGYNTIRIKASAPGYEPSTVEHEVYYIPIADIYTRKAWSMKDQYTDYLNNSDRRIANTQIYQVDGVCKEILSPNPQMAVFELTDGSGRIVTMTNYTYDNWKAGSTYRLFGDAYGIYNGGPWLNGRYSYIQKEKEKTEAP